MSGTEKPFTFEEYKSFIFNEVKRYTSGTEGEKTVAQGAAAFIEVLTNTGRPIAEALAADKNAAGADNVFQPDLKKHFPGGLANLAKINPYVAVADMAADLLKTEGGQKIMCAVAGIAEDPTKFGKGLGSALTDVGKGSANFLTSTSEAFAKAAKAAAEANDKITDSLLASVKKSVKLVNESLIETVDTLLSVHRKVLATGQETLDATGKGVLTLTTIPQKVVESVFMAPVSLAGTFVRGIKKLGHEIKTPYAPETRSGGAENLTMRDVLRVTLMIVFVIFIVLFISHLCNESVDKKADKPDLYYPLLVLGCVFIAGYIGKSALRAKQQ